MSYVTTDESDFDSVNLLIDRTCSVFSYYGEKKNRNAKPKKKSPTKERASHGLPKRYIFALLGFLGMANVYAMRANLSVSILAMVNNTVENVRNDTNVVIECPDLLQSAAVNPLKFVQTYQYDWTEETINRILGSFFYGYVLTEIPGGYLSQQTSGKWLFGGGILVTALLTILTPAVVMWGVNALMVNRILEGLAEGVTKSSMNHMISRWSPKCERSRVSSFIFSGGLVGDVFTLAISGWMSSSRIFGGWPSVFYLFGILSIIWFVFWSKLVFDSPLEDPTISESELIYFEENQEIIHKNPTVPWVAIFTSLPMWAVIVCHFGSCLGFLTLFLALPTYLETVLHFDIEMDGNLAALPFLCLAISSWISAYMADRLRETERLSITTIRKIFNTIGLLGPAAVLYCVTLSGCRAKLIIALVCLAMVLNGFCFSGYQVTHIDMSPDFAGILFGISGAIADLNGIFGPALITAFTYNETTTGNWNKVFYVMCLGYTVGAVFYLLFASAELQPWGLDKKALSIKESLSNEINISIRDRKGKMSSSTK